MKKKVIAVALVAVMAMTMMTGCAGFTVIKTGTEDQFTGKTAFSAGDNVDSFWDSKAVPELTKNAVDLVTLLKEANGDLKSVQDKYAGTSLQNSTSLTYTVKGTAKVDSVNTESKAGTMKILVDGYDGDIDVEVQIGPVFKGTCVRDALSFIKFGDYTNQTEYSQVNQSINKKIEATVISPDTANDYVGKTISFIGCFAPGTDNSKILITPVVITTS